MYDTIIISGGNIRKEFALHFLESETEKSRRAGKKLTLVAADKGMEFFRSCQMIPDYVVGDFDSLSEDGKEYLDKLEQQENLEVIRLKPEKDDSDTQSAANYAIRRGARRIALLGATGSRLDHVMANIGLLAHGKEKGCQISILDENNAISLIESGTILKKDTQFGQYVSFFPLDGEVKGLTLQGFKYALDHYDLRTADSGLTVSNEIKEKTASVTYTEGTLLMMMSRD